MLTMTTSPSPAVPVLVVGVSGFVGRRLAEAFLASGQAVRGVARNPDKVSLPASLALGVVRGDMLDPASLKAACRGVAAVYVCTHTLTRQQVGGTPGGYMDLELAGLRNIVSACEASGVRRLVYVTSIGVEPEAPSSWLRERWNAEQYLFGSGLNVTVFRPGMIVGIGGQGFNALLGGARRRTATVLAPRGQRFRPIAVSDLTRYMVDVLDEPRSFGRAFEVGTDEVMTMDQMIDIAAECLGRDHPRKRHLPLRTIRTLTPLLERAGRLPRGALAGTLDSMRVDLVGDPADIRQLLGSPLRSFRQAVRDELAAAEPDRQAARA
jgi:uncharacterized protein YbjT (DUF2867 family)